MEDRRTPRWIFKALSKRRLAFNWLNCCFDFAATPESAVALDFWTIEDDALSKSKEEIRAALEGKAGPVWLHPPTKNIRNWVPFIRKVNEVIAKMPAISELAVLLPASTDAHWFKQLCGHATSVWLINGRLRSATAEGKKSTFPKGSAIFFFKDVQYDERHEPKIRVMELKKRRWLDFV